MDSDSQKKLQNTNEKRLKEETTKWTQIHKETIVVRATLPNLKNT